MSTYCSSVPEERPFPQTPSYGDRHQLPSSFPDRIPSFKTDVDNIPGPLTHEKLAEHNCDSFSRRPGVPGLPYPHASRQSQGGRTEDDASLKLDGSICSDLPHRLGVTGVVPSQAACRKQNRTCDNWKEGSVLEVFSASAGQWYAAQVGQVEPQSDGSEDIVTVVFYIGDQIKQKSIYRTDAALAALGTHTFNELPPGFETRPSQSKPGQLVYFDLTAGIKYGWTNAIFILEASLVCMSMYASLELAWHVHFERLKQQPAGCETVACVPAGRGPRAPVLQAPIAEIPSPMPLACTICGSFSQVISQK
ncbi:RFESD [Symbiodinium natans]|uniref:RFESD protein n=1 Tax=Symbiodinium natans TaxID=878477 RepID=A0A812U683_9DINO|nr:RFESD [Symbiodinium natans]